MKRVNTVIADNSHANCMANRFFKISKLFLKNSVKDIITFGHISKLLLPMKNMFTEH